MGKNGRYPKNSINGMVNEQLKSLADQLIAFGKDEKEENKSSRKKSAAKKK